MFRCTKFGLHESFCRYVFGLKSLVVKLLCLDEYFQFLIHRNNYIMLSLRFYYLVENLYPILACLGISNYKWDPNALVFRKKSGRNFVSYYHVFFQYCSIAFNFYQIARFYLLRQLIDLVLVCSLTTGYFLGILAITVNICNGDDFFLMVNMCLVYLRRINRKHFLMKKFDPLN